MKQKNAETGTRVEFYYHIWYNSSSLCDIKALKVLEQFADGVTFEPSSCAWSWGFHGFMNHWHSTYNAFRALHIVFGKDPRSEYGLILRTGTDVAYHKLPSQFNNFSHTFHEFAAKGNPMAKNNFIMIGYANGYDRHALGTPSLMKVYSLYGSNNDGYGCDSRYDSFVFQRMARYGVWVPPALRNSVPPFVVTKAQKSYDLPYRCAPLYTKFNGFFKGSLWRPSDNVGCREHDLSHSTIIDSVTPPHILDHNNTKSRRLAVAPPIGFRKADKAYCAGHQFDQLNTPPLNADSADTPSSIVSHHHHHVTFNLVSDERISSSSSHAPLSRR